MRLIYIANIRVPTEKAHGLQIMQNCEALADAGADVHLWAARRVNTPQMKAISDPFAHYGVKPNFTLERLPTLDLLPLVPDRDDLPARLIFAVQWITFTIAALLRLVGARADVVYTRDALLLAAASLITPRRKLAYEPHTASSGRLGRALQRFALRRAGTVFPLTRRLGDDLIAMGAEAARVFPAHDGIQAARFADLPAKREARARLGWQPDLFIVGYVGRLHTMNMDKGVGLLVDAVLEAGGTALALVGGSGDRAAALRERWKAGGGDPDHLLDVGEVPPGDVPLYLAALDVCAMMLPFTPHFAYYASPLKLFEYMAAGRAILASNFPAFREVVTDGETALLVPPDDPAALAAAIRRLQDDPALCQRLGAAARARVMAEYTWAARAALILARIREA